MKQKKFKFLGKKIFYILLFFLKPFYIVIFCFFFIILKCLREQKKTIENYNTKKINDNLIISDQVKLESADILSYISDAIRITHYYGNLRMKYVGFNFTFLGFYTSIIAIYVSFYREDPVIIWFKGWPMILVFLGYLLILLTIVLNKFDTIKFDHAYLRHFSSIMDNKNYPYIEKKHIDEFNKLIGSKKSSEKINNLKTLLLQYQYQRNYSRLALLMRNCLIYGITVSLIAIGYSLIASFF